MEAAHGPQIYVRQNRLNRLLVINRGRFNGEHSMFLDPEGAGDTSD